MNIPETPLESWKEIAAYLQRDATTARRWEKEEGLPVHRHNHKSRSSVYAYPSEIDSWRASRKVVRESIPARPLWKLPAFAVTMLLCLIMVGNGVRPVSAQQRGAHSKDVMVERVPTGDADLEGRISTDGRYLTFVDWVSGGNVAIRDLNTGKNRTLAHDADNHQYAFEPVPSPDGKQVAYLWHGKEDSLRVIGADGSHMRELVPHMEGAFAPRWSPDGKQIAAGQENPADKTKQIVLVSVKDSSITQLKSTGWQEPDIGGFSTDGRFLVYSLEKSPSKTDSGIFSISADGSHEIPLIQGPASYRDPIWTPDGRSVLFTSDRSGTMDLWSIGVRDGQPQGEPERVRPNIGSISTAGFARDGSLYYETSESQTDLNSVAFDPDKLTTGAPVRITDRFVGSNYDPELSPDGKSLAFLRKSVTGGPDSVIIRLQETGEERPLIQLSTGYPRNRRIHWSADGRSVLLEDATNNRKTLRRVDIETGNARTIFEGPYEILRMEISRDGKTLFYSSLAASATRPALYDLRFVRRNLDSGRETELYRADSVGNAFVGIALSPDEKSLAFVVQLADMSYWTIPVTGGTPKEVYHGGGRGQVAWSKDGRFLVTAGTQWVAIPAEGGEPRMLGAAAKGYVSSLSPDGRQILFTSAQDKFELWALRNFLSDSLQTR